MHHTVTPIELPVLRLRLAPAADSAFTLIELLVVITIIVVLLSLLTPALDRAVYQAELAVCAAQMHAVVKGASVYAADHRRRYPHRNNLDSSGWELHKVYDGAWHDGDDRVTFDGYIGMKQFTDPLNPQKMDFSIGGTDQDSSVYVGYSMWFGWQYRTANVTGSAMKKLGDRWSWTSIHPNDANRSTPVTHRSQVLVGDDDIQSFENQESWAAHLDADGVMVPWVLDDQDAITDAVGIGINTRFKQTRSQWRALERFDRGTTDLNFGHQDGSVGRMPEAMVSDERMFYAPFSNSSDSAFGVFWSQIPLN